MSAYLRAVRRIQTAAIPHGVSFLLHHSGWQDGEQKKKRERGSSAFRGNVDATLYLEAQPAEGHGGDVRLVLRVLKLRDSERRTPIRMLRRKVDLPTFDHFGNPMSSCIVVPDPRTYAEALAQEQAHTKEAAATQEHALDLELLKVIRDHNPTTQDMLRHYLHVKKEVVQAALARVLKSGRVRLPIKQRTPYLLTPDGEAVLNGIAGSGGPTA